MVKIKIAFKTHPLSMHGKLYFYQLEAVSLSTTPQKATFSNTLFHVSSVSDFVFFSVFEVMLSSQLFICEIRLKMLRCERGGTNSVYETPLSSCQHLLQPSISFADCWSLVKLKLQMNLDILGRSRLISMQYFPGIMNFI